MQKMSAEMAEAVANSIVAIDVAWEPACPAEDILILDLLSEDIADRVSRDTVCRLFNLPKGACQD